MFFGRNGTYCIVPKRVSIMLYVSLNESFLPEEEEGNGRILIYFQRGFGVTITVSTRYPACN